MNEPELPIEAMSEFNAAATYAELVPEADMTPIELELKTKDEEQLSELLFSFGEDWTDAERASVRSGLDLAGRLHADDKYKGDPYTTHLLRVANRIAGYLEKPEPELVVAGLLHDSVEDHPEGIVGAETALPENAKELQALALDKLAAEFSPRTAATVKAVTNPPDMGQGGSREEWLAAYGRKVEQAAETADGWMVKFADWCDNGLGMKFSEPSIGEAKKEEWKDKYGRSLKALQRRYREPMEPEADIREQLPPAARAYVEQQFALGHERLKAAE